MIPYDSKYRFDLQQEKLYRNSSLLNDKWYRKLFGGTWRYLKFDENTPNLKIHTFWTKISVYDWNEHVIVLETEIFPETGVDNKWKLYKEFFKQLFNGIIYLIKNNYMSGNSNYAYHKDNKKLLKKKLNQHKKKKFFR
jgi:hypothetical protein